MHRISSDLRSLAAQGPVSTGVGDRPGRPQGVASFCSLSAHGACIVAANSTRHCAVPGSTQFGTTRCAPLAQSKSCSSASACYRAANKNAVNAPACQQYLQRGQPQRSLTLTNRYCEQRKTFTRHALVGVATLRRAGESSADNARPAQSKLQGCKSSAVRCMPSRPFGYDQV